MKRLVVLAQGTVRPAFTQGSVKRAGSPKVQFRYISVIH